MLELVTRMVQSVVAFVMALFLEQNPLVLVTALLVGLAEEAGL
jgi:hypothetical protein